MTSEEAIEELLAWFEEEEARYEEEEEEEESPSKSSDPALRSHTLQNLQRYKGELEIAIIKGLVKLEPISKLKLIRTGLSPKTIRRLLKCAILEENVDRATGIPYYRVTDVFRNKQIIRASLRS